MTTIFQPSALPSGGLSLAVGEHVVTGTDVSNTQAAIITGFSTATGGSRTGSAIVAFQVQIRRDGALLPEDASVSIPGPEDPLAETVLVVEDGGEGGYELTEGDVISYWIAGWRS